VTSDGEAVPRVLRVHTGSALLRSRKSPLTFHWV
jgi:hypothetical protein